MASSSNTIFLAAQDRPERRRNFTRRQRTGCYLIQQRLEQMKVAPIDQGDLDRCIPQGLGCAQAPEPSAEYHDAMHPILMMPTEDCCAEGGRR